MITRENGNIVQTKDGVRRVYSVMDPQFGALQVTLSKQEGAATTNTNVAQNYNDLITRMQISVDAGHPATQPPKPPMLVIDDDGKESYVPFDPPLNDLKTAPPARPAPSAGSPIPTLPVGVGGLTGDEQRAQFNMISAMFHDRFKG